MCWDGFFIIGLKLFIKMKDSMITEKFSNKILCWFDQHGRKDLPWQQSISPYRVWISEIMLQQTQVKTVIPYFEAFMARFPDVFSLAVGSIDEVLGLWSGLGYYARARNLHLTAKKIVAEWNGVFPDCLEVLSGLPGIGRSTAGAILAISHGKRAAILDGNVRRVLCRFHAVEGFPGETKVQRQLWNLAETHTPETRVGEYTQAMMDLGAMLCKRSSPDCTKCPLREECLAYQQGNIQGYPYPKPKKLKPIKSSFMLLLICKEEIFLYKRPQIGVWGGLWSLPEFPDGKAVQEFCALQGLSCHDKSYGEVYRHTFTHFHLDVVPVCVQVSQKSFGVMEDHQQAWYGFNDLNQLGLPALVKKLLNLH